MFELLEECLNFYTVSITEVRMHTTFQKTDNALESAKGLESILFRTRHTEAAATPPVIIGCEAATEAPSAPNKCRYKQIKDLTSKRKETGNLTLSKNK